MRLSVLVGKTAAINIVAALHEIADVAVNPQACFGSGNIEISRTVGVTDPDILCRFRLGCDYSVSAIGNGQVARGRNTACQQ